MLIKSASDRFLSARSELISLPALNLFMSCAYILNASCLSQARVALMSLSKETLSPGKSSVRPVCGCSFFSGSNS
ncbi:unnamed protein product [Dibothriocephalus latus]|uniref:Uncharacterized protein n=1 Tax=Dibothriocephalus latus TaxID=60516 RepID=A0A3P7ND56_DIBLA|nr:unnamed protein product [Dibothriocephalus latus]